MIAIFCWFLVNLSISFGFPEDGSPLCTLQAVLWLYGTKTAVNWWALLMYRWLSDTTSWRALSTLEMHAIGWSSCLACFLPLLKLRLGRADELFVDGLFVCMYGSSTTSLPQLSYWFLIPYISSVLLTLFVAAVFGVYLYGRFREVGSSTLVFLLPTSIVLLWIPFFAVLIMLLSGFLPVNSYTSKLMSALFLLAMQCGVPLVMAHYATKVKLRQKWWKLVVEGVIQRPSNIRSSFLSEVESSMWRGTVAEPSLMSVSGPDLPDLTDGWAEARARSVGVGGGWC